MSKLTWHKETKTWLIDGKPSTRKKGQRGSDPVRRLPRGTFPPKLTLAEKQNLKETDPHMYLRVCSTREFIRYVEARLPKRIKRKTRSEQAKRLGITVRQLNYSIRLLRQGKEVRVRELNRKRANLRERMSILRARITAEMGI